MIENGGENVTDLPVALSLAAPEPHLDQNLFPVVGIGASAGGLDALTQLFSALEVSTGMAYVVIQHLDPTHASLLPSLLARVTSLPVLEGQEGMALSPDHVYVIPAHADMTLEHGVLRLFPRREERGRRFAIDAFFFSLAHERGPRAIGVVLSGTASDGTVGLQEIKAEGGITFAQDEQTASFPQMPQHAIAAGCVDQVLPPAEIARELTRLRTHPVLAGLLTQPSTPPISSEREEQAFIAVLLALSQHTGIDFLTYKRTTLTRRVLRRMAVLHLNHFTEYAAYLREHPTERETLYQEVLIPVTSFFRDEAAFAALARFAFPEIVSRLVPEEAIRLWVPGCSTGEEAYSLLICLREFLEEGHLSWPIQLFATDINPRCIARARAGVYPAQTLSALSPARLERFFDPLDTEQGSYRVARAVREQCVFALHNVLQDPPFTHLDLVSCRNVLIYLGADAQQQVLRLFHYALKPQGFLLLGNAESVDPLSRLFAPIERQQKLYTRKEAAVSMPLFGETTVREEATVSHAQHEEQPRGSTAMPQTNFQQEVDQILLANYVPASVVIDRTMEILQVRGHTSFYLELAPGKMGVNLLKMAREGLGSSLRSVIAAARKNNRLATKEQVQVSAFGTTRTIRITALPLHEPADGGCVLILFEELIPQPSTPSSGQSSTRSPSARRIAALELELATMKTGMQKALEEYETSKEELQAANEEIRSSNEELQSINEELEASQEELQSTNQELLTSNQALSRRNEEVQVAQERADAIVETVREPLAVLTEDGHVKRVNAAFAQFFQVSPQESEGRLLSEVKQGQCALAGLLPLLERVRTTNEAVSDYEVEQTFPVIGHKVLCLNLRRVVNEPPDAGDHWFLLAIEDITARKELERREQEAHADMDARLQVFQLILDRLPNGVFLVQGPHLRLLLANQAAADLWGAEWPRGQSEEEFFDQHDIQLFTVDGQLLPQNNVTGRRAMATGEPVLAHQLVIRRSDGTRLPVVVDAIPFLDPAQFPRLPQEMTADAEAARVVLVVYQDVSALKEAEALKDQFISLATHELRTPVTIITGYADRLLSRTVQGKGHVLDDWQREKVQEMKQVSWQLANLTTDLLDVTRMQAGEFELEWRLTDLVALTQRVVKKFQATTDQHHLRFHTALQELQATVDGIRIEQVLSNLLSNAIKYSPEGGPIEITLEEDAKTHEACFRIRDQGMGIPRAQQAQLFGRFVRGENGRAAGIRGTGLGLYLCRELVERHDGHISFASEEGVGSTFFFSLPCTETVHQENGNALYERTDPA